jgi:2-iminobutanoate/2-iminopropanoate deaminase
MQFFNSINAPKPVGPYSQAVKAGDFIFCSGQIGLVPETSKIIEGGINAQTVQIFANIIEILKASGASLDNVVKVQIFLKDITDFAIVNQIYAEFFGDHKPARDTIEVSNLPLNAIVEISITAYKSNI